MSAEPIVTATLAELYIRQGHTERGRAIYRQLAAREPANAAYVQRLTELDCSSNRSKGEVMSFREHLERINTGVEGCLSCSIMGIDGIPIDSVTNQEHTIDVDISSVLVEYAGLIGQLQRSSDLLGAGNVHEYFLKTDKIVAVMHPITSEYFLGLILKQNGNLGKGRFLLRVIAPKLVDELS